MKRIICDVLIVGGGGAALRAAIAAKEYDNKCKVTLAVKGKLGTTGTTANSCSDRMAFHSTLPFTEPKTDNNWKYHASDIYEVGGRVSDYDLAEILAKKSGEAFQYLDSIGVPFVYKAGRPEQFVTDGSVYPRACYTGPNTAIDIEKALVRKVKELEIELVQNTMITNLKVSNGIIRGAFGVNENNEAIYFSTSAILLCTGGAGEIFKYNVYPKGAYGDGYALALNAGAELVNMEFIQFGLSSLKTKLACSGSLFRSIPRIINDKHEEFLGTVHNFSSIYNIVFEKGASWPVSAEHVSSMIDTAVFNEMAKGNHVYLDFAKNPVDFNFSLLDEKNRKRFEDELQVEVTEEILQTSPIERLKVINPKVINWLKDRGIDLVKGDKIEIAPAAQHFQGGIKIRKQGETNIKGLFAAGECAGGQHGANRPGGNALMDCQVFGKISGTSAAQYSLNSKNSAITDASISDGSISDGSMDDLDRKEQIKVGKDNSITIEELKKQLNLIMSRYASVVRTRDGLILLYAKIATLKSKEIEKDEENLINYYETLDMLLTAETIAIACIQRVESRGPHLYFEEEGKDHHMNKSKEYEKYFVIRKENGELKVSPQETVKNNKYVNGVELHEE